MPSRTGDYYNVSPYTDIGYGIAGIPFFRINNGQIEPEGDDLLVSYTIAATRLPTELLIYVGGDSVDGNSGIKHSRWAWASSQPGTRFEVLAKTVTIMDTGSGTSALNWKTYGADNNTAKVLVRITNPAGISNFTATSNHLDSDGTERVYSNVGQRADYNGIAVLVARPVAAPPPTVTAVPGLSPTPLALLLALMPAAIWLTRRGSRT